MLLIAVCFAGYLFQLLRKLFDHFMVLKFFMLLLMLSRLKNLNHSLFFASNHFNFVLQHFNFAPKIHYLRYFRILTKS